MVFFFTTSHGGQEYHIYMGKDKYENEDLLKIGWPEDVWFHVDDFSSAHVYLRLHEGETIASIPPEIVNDCAQLVKANSIEGNKQKVRVVYTPFPNLHKTNGMDVGQVGYHNTKACVYTSIEKRDNVIVNRISKTRTEHDMAYVKKLREERDLKERQKEKFAKKEAAEMEKKMKEDRLKEKEARSYDSLFKKENMTSNREVALAAAASSASASSSAASAPPAEDDFM